ncbi:hypothetical protein PRIPAC_76885 [Pristionchus pacificus]|uniref:Uncharacterized protein n=1 Tax=Pristionchus pacificus TaxID=54126 RepID=A0A2A6BWS8_PRIPA|nr:hypothetical protein PRIPAC_76885 [Pristionchus pacificus]|eukprot:PDM70355.1 hypothetical protein PRIPAC_46601 [Pristionchus pacificus]
MFTVDLQDRHTTAMNLLVRRHSVQELFLSVMHAGLTDPRSALCQLAAGVRSIRLVQRGVGVGRNAAYLLGVFDADWSEIILEMYDGGRLEKLYIDNENYSNYLSLPAAERLRAASKALKHAVDSCASRPKTIQLVDQLEIMTQHLSITFSFNVPIWKTNVFEMRLRANNLPCDRITRNKHTGIAVHRVHDEHIDFICSIVDAHAVNRLDLVVGKNATSNPRKALLDLSSRISSLLIRQVNPFHKWGWPVKLMFGDIDWSSVILEMFADSRKLDKLFLDGNQNPDFITGVGELKLRRCWPKLRKRVWFTANLPRSGEEIDCTEKEYAIKGNLCIPMAKNK